MFRGTFLVILAALPCLAQPIPYRLTAVAPAVQTQNAASYAQNLSVTPGPGTITVSYRDANKNAMNPPIAGATFVVTGPPTVNGQVFGTLMVLDPRGTFTAKSTASGAANRAFASISNVSASPICTGGPADQSCTMNAMSVAPTGEVSVDVTVQIFPDVGIGVSYEATFRFRWTKTGADLISLSGALPAAGAISPGLSPAFSGSAQYTLNSADTGTVTLKVKSGDTTLGSSNAVNVNRGSGSTSTLSIAPFQLPLAGTIRLVAVLQSSVQATDSNEVSYTIGCAAQSPPRRAACEADLAIDHIQGVQVIQLRDNSIDLVVGKETEVRVFVKSVGENAGPLTEIGFYQPGSDTMTGRGNIVAFPNQVSLVNIENSGRVFRSDNGYQYDDVSKSGGMYQVVLPDGKGGSLGEPSLINNVMDFVPRFVQAGTIDYGIGTVCTRNQSGQTVCPSYPDSSYQPYRIRGAVPASDVTETRWLLPSMIFDEALFTQPDTAALATSIMINEFLRTQHLTGLYQIMRGEDIDLNQMIFLLPGSGADADQYFGETKPGEAPGLGQFWWVRREACSNCIRATAIAHGIAHNLGLVHSELSQLTPEPTATRWYRDLVSHKYVGHDSLMLKGSGSGAQSVQSNVPISVPEYRNLLAVLKNKTLPPLASANRKAGEIADTVVISGSVARDGTTGTLDPAFHALSSAPHAASNPTGDTCLRFFPAATDFCFSVKYATGATKGYFAVAATLPAGTQRVALIRGGQERASMTAGTAPQVSFLAPLGGENWQGTQKVRWSATGSGLLYRLDYSPDNGTTWLPLSRELTLPEYEFNTADIVGGTVRFRVTASSGLTNVSAISPSVQVPQTGVLSFDQTTVDFGNVLPGQGVADRTIVVSNTGASMMLVRVGESSQAAFQRVSQPGFFLKAGETASVQVGLDTSTAGLKTGTLLVGSQSVTLKANVTSTPAPSIDFAGAVADLGMVQTTKTKTRKVRIRNVGSANLVISSFNVSGSGFSFVGPVGTQTVEPGASVDAEVRYTAGGSVGTPTGTLTVASNDPSRAQFAIPLRVQVVAGAIPAATAEGVANSSNYKGGGVSPGEMVVIFGSDAGPAALANLRLDDTGKVATELGGTRVYFDDVPAPLIFAQAGVLSAVVPYSVAGADSTEMVIEYQGRRSDPVTLPVVAAVPGLFSQNSSGTGPGAILNQDYSLNTVQNPAARGSAIVLYGSGEGVLDAPVVDGSVTAALFRPILPVSVTIGGVAQEVLFAGAAPGLVAGVLQVNVKIAANTPTGNQAVVVTIGSASSQAGLTVAIAGGAPQPAIEVPSTTLDFGAVSSGQTKDQTVAVKNNGNATLTVNSVSSNNARFAATAPATPFSVGAGGTQNVTLRFSPNAVGTQSGTITFASNDPAKPNATLAVTGTGSAAGGSTALTITSVAGFPNGRVSNQLPALAIDGNTSTFTWTTESGSAAAPAYLAVSLGAANTISRLRIYKDNDTGGSGDLPKNLVIEYTTSATSVALASRVWTPVTGLTNGFNGTELMTATSVNANGTVTGDNHVSQTSGFASLTFTPVNATGIRIGFSNAAQVTQNHYRVYELQLLQ